jgi:hypothetical protein
MSSLQFSMHDIVDIVVETGDSASTNRWVDIILIDTKGDETRITAFTDDKEATQSLNEFIAKNT